MLKAKSMADHRASVEAEDHHTSVEAEEQIDFDGDSDIEDIMYDEDVTEDVGYRKVRDENIDEEQEPEGEGSDKVEASDGPDDVSSSLKDEVNPVGSKDEDDIQKRAELLALPPHGSEVFIGGISRDAIEEDLSGLCESFGEIFEVKLTKDKDTKENKGFAFIAFTTKDAAQKAIEEIHDKEFKGRTLRCSLSQAKHKLFIGNVPRSLREEDLRKIFEDCGPGVENIECVKDLQNPNRNRGFIFIEYYNHACAEYARQKMSKPNFKLEGSALNVSWADPKSSSDSPAAAQVKAIYVKNLPENVTREKMKKIFECYGEVTKVVLPPSRAGQDKPGFGFVHFAERSSALKAVKGTQKYEINGHIMVVTLAKPQTDKKSYPKPGFTPSYHPLYPSYGYAADLYGAYATGYGAAGYNQPMIYGRGPMPPGMRMVPMVLPDGRTGYVLQQPGALTPLPFPPPPRRSNHRGDRSDNKDKGSDGGRYRPY